MNPIFAIFALFVLGLQDFDGNNGIASVSGILVELVWCVNPLYKAELVDKPIDYLKYITSVNDLVTDITKTFRQHGATEENKQNAINCLKQLEEDENDSKLVQAAIKDIPNRVT